MPLGKLRLRQQRRMKKPCEKINQDIVDMRPSSRSKISCYEENELDKKNIGSGQESWQVFRTGEELTTSDSFYTDEFYYTGDGFVKDFSLGMTSK